MDKERANTLVCDECHKKFSTVSARNRHLRDFHGQITQQKSINIICPICPTEEKTPLKNNEHLITHLTEGHGLNIKESNLNFKTIEDFQNWRSQADREVNYTTSSKSMSYGITYIYYNCNRSNTIGSCSIAEKRAIKAGGSIKISGVCPSRICVRIMTNGNVMVKFIETHVGHEDEMRTKRLTTNQQKIVVDQLKGGVAIERILQDVRKIENQKLERVNLIKRGDLQYLMRKFNIDKKRDADDMVATILKIEEWNKEGKNQAFLVKKIELCNDDCRRVYCEKCKVCVHRYECECPEFCVKSNLCKHIHAVALYEKRRSESVLGSSESSNGEEQLCIDETTTSKIAYQEELNQFINNKSENKNELNIDSYKVKSLSSASLRTTPTRSPVAEFPKTPPSSPDTRLRSYRDWDLDSIASTTSGLSIASCDHASVAHNGTTFSGKTKRYVVHCSEHSGQIGEDYLTPTQRANREVKKLKSLLQQTHRELDVKNTDILRLTKEVVELRLYKAALSSPEDKSNSSSDAITVREVLEDDDVDCVVGNHINVERTSSCADSGHYDDLTNSSVHSKDSVNVGDDNLSPYKAKTPIETADKAVTADFGPRDPQSEHQRLVVEYEKQLQDLIKTHENECHMMKQKHNDKVDELLQRLSDVNARYWELVPDLESARERIKELEKQLEEVSRSLEEKESYFKVYSEGSQALNSASNCEQSSPIVRYPVNRVSVPELLHQLEVTRNELDKVKDVEYASTSNNAQPLLSAKEAVSLWVLGARKAMYKQLVEARSKNKVDPEITLQFLKSAIYYFLTDKENNQGHLRAIQSILGYTPTEISNIDRARFNY